MSASSALRTDPPTGPSLFRVDLAVELAVFPNQIVDLATRIHAR